MNFSKNNKGLDKTAFSDNFRVKVIYHVVGYPADRRE
jgi:hypothetical protein